MKTYRPHRNDTVHGREQHVGINYKILGKNIKYYRKQNNLTQEQMAESLELSVGFISQVERGIAKMSLDTLIDLCDLLNCSAGDLLNSAHTEYRDKLSGDLLTLYEQIPKKDQTLFYYMLKAYVDHL